MSLVPVVLTTGYATLTNIADGDVRYYMDVGAQTVNIDTAIWAVTQKTDDTDMRNTALDTNPRTAEKA